MSWVRNLHLEKLEAHRATVTTTAGYRELIKFMTPQRQEQLGAVFQEVLGRKVRVEISDPGSESGGDASATSSGTSRIDHAKAVSLPTVCKVLDHFNAVVVEARPGRPEDKTNREVDEETASNTATPTT